MALRSTSACTTGRNQPLSVIGEESLDLANPDVLSDQREAYGFSPATDVPPAAEEPLGVGFSPQGSAAATPFALRRDTHVPEGTKSCGTDKESPPAPPTVLTTPFFVDPLETPSAQAEDDSPTLSRRIGQEPPAASRHRQKNSGSAATTVPGECVLTSGLAVNRHPQRLTPRLQPTHLTPPRNIALRL